MSYPKQNPKSSKQDYETSKEFIDAVELRFGKLAADLAGTEDDKKAPIVITPLENSLAVNWSQRFTRGNLWLNPPFGNIADWAAKCAFETGQRDGRILMLVPASIGSKWFMDHVLPYAFVHALTPRLTFGDCRDPYPKDCMLCEYGEVTGFDVWQWRAPKKRGPGLAKVAAPLPVEDTQGPEGHHE